MAQQEESVAHLVPAFEALVLVQWELVYTALAGASLAATEVERRDQVPVPGKAAAGVLLMNPHLRIPMAGKGGSWGR